MTGEMSNINMSKFVLSILFQKILREAKAHLLFFYINDSNRSVSYYATVSVIDNCTLMRSDA